jgi:hypothetical protein
MQYTDSDKGLTRQMLARLLAVKESRYQALRARRDLKERLLLQIVVPVTLILTALFAWRSGWSTMRGTRS